MRQILRGPRTALPRRQVGGLGQHLYQIAFQEIGSDFQTGAGLELKSEFSECCWARKHPTLPCSHHTLPCKHHTSPCKHPISPCKHPFSPYDHHSSPCKHSTSPAKHALARTLCE